MEDFRTVHESSGAGDRTLRSAPAPATWLPCDYVHPTYAPVAYGHHLRPIREADVELEMIAVMGSQPRLWRIYGRVWGWPSATLTREQDQSELARHEEAMARRQSFMYALFDADETALLGCVHIDPAEKAGADADISWWVVDECVGTDLEAALDALVPGWIARDWPFERPRFVGRDISWDEWLDLPS